MLEQKDRKHFFESRPWGNYEILHKETGFEVKRVELNPHSRLSLQKHMKRSEKWIVTKGEGIATVSDEEIPVRGGSIVDVHTGEMHRMANTGDVPLVFVEVQFGQYLEEDDIVRFEDDYGRIKK
jgi:mannose-6-phosphate isomerase-like protein (cupin superfamily)